MEFGKRHDTADTTAFCRRANLLRTCHEETVAMDFGLITVLSLRYPINEDVDTGIYRNPVPDYYNLTLELSRDRTTRAWSVQCTATDNGNGLCPSERILYVI